METTLMSNLQRDSMVGSFTRISANQKMKMQLNEEDCTKSKAIKDRSSTSVTSQVTSNT